MTHISVITVVLNGASTIGDCLGSVRSQTRSVEHIVIDGGSTDGTLDLLEEHGGHCARIVSESDEGIYDAMNKGVALASGDIVGTLNADDFYAHDRVIDCVAAIFGESDIGACYGDLLYVDDKDTNKVVRSWKAGRYVRDKFYQGWMPPNPTFFVRRELLKKYGSFNTALGTAADYELMLRFLFRHGVKPAYIPEVLVKMRTGGASNATLGRRLEANRMDRRAWKINGLRPRPWTIPFKPLRKMGQYLRPLWPPEGRP